MPEYYLELPIDEHDSIRVEVTRQATGLVRASRVSDTIGRATERLDDAVAELAKMGEKVVTRLKDAVEPPSAVEVALGLKLTTKSGFVIAETAAEAHVVVKLEWSGAARIRGRKKNDEPPETAQTNSEDQQTPGD